SIDYISFRWTRLLQQAGLRPKTVTKRVEGKKVTTWGGGGDGRGFRGIRTTFANSIPPGYRDEQEIIMGHSHGTTLLDDYLEEVGTKRLKEVVDHVWKRVFKGRRK